MYTSFLRPLSVFGLAAAAVLGLAGTANAQDTSIRFGSDMFAAGTSASVSEAVDNDVFAMGNDVRVTAEAGGDVHAMGNSVLLSGDVGGNVYAAGNSVTISGAVTADVSAAGNNVSISGPVNGSVRGAGARVSIDADVGGSAAAAAETLALNAVIAGDLSFSGNRIEFGDGAQVLGQVSIETTGDIDVPASVASADRVTITISENPDFSHAAREIATQTSRSFVGELFGSIFLFGAVFVVGALWIALMPKRSDASREAALARPWRSLLAGVFALSGFIGLTIVLVMTVIGIFIAPFAIVLAILAWVLGLAAGGYYLSARLGAAFGQGTDNVGMKLLFLAVGLVLFWIIGFIPFAGWPLQVLLVIFGLGGMTMAALFGAPTDEAEALPA